MKLTRKRFVLEFESAEQAEEFKRLARAKGMTHWQLIKWLAENTPRRKG